jgi:hypothetical protein
MVAQFSTCTFTLRTEKTSGEVVELVVCAKNKWGNWWDFLFYVMLEDAEGSRVTSIHPVLALLHHLLAV